MPPQVDFSVDDNTAVADQEAMKRYANKLKIRVLLGIALTAVVISSVLCIVILVVLFRESPAREFHPDSPSSLYKTESRHADIASYPSHSPWMGIPQDGQRYMFPPTLYPGYFGQRLARPDHGGVSMGGLSEDDVSLRQAQQHRTYVPTEQSPISNNWPVRSSQGIEYRKPTSNMGLRKFTPQQTEETLFSIPTSKPEVVTIPAVPQRPDETASSAVPATAPPVRQSDVLSFAEKMHLHTTSKLSDRYLREVYEHNSTNEQMLSVTKYIESVLCPGRAECHPLWDRYQSLDGTCNNQANADWGKANNCMKRILPAHYADGVSAPRRNSASPTRVSMLLQGAKLPPLSTKAPRKLNLFLMAFMQFVTHDLASTVSSEVHNTSCCSHPDRDECSLAIDTSSDPFYTERGVNCINFVRSARCPCSEERPREQLNSATPYLDLGPVYGRTLEESIRLRDKEQTFLLETSEPGLPPYDGEHCREPGKCFHGDSKISQQHALSMIHVMFLRYHNHLALSVRNRHTDWSNDTVYLEARRMAIFHYQVIVFRELLPALIGEEACRCLGIHFDDLVNGTSYDSENEAGVYNEFTTAVFRAHTLIPASFGSIAIKYFDTDEFKDKSYLAILLEELFRTQTSRGFPATESTVHHALDQRNGSYGLNMIALNVQRGRDHGLAPYVKYVGQRMKINITMWTDLIKYHVLPIERVKVLRKIYSKVEDIDLFIGKDLETKPLPGVLGLTFEETLAKQFREIAMRDRFFFSHTRVDWTEAHRLAWKANIDKGWMSYVLCTAFAREAQIFPRRTMFVLDDDNFSTCDQEQERWLGLAEAEEADD